jgi:hypothetical protein
LKAGLIKARGHSAVMQQRHEAGDSLDDFPTPPWATRALLDWLQWCVRPGMVCREPAANRGHMVRALCERFDAVEARDVHDYGAGFGVRDYLAQGEFTTVDWTITNPPFNAIEPFIQKALATSRVGVAMLCRTAIIEGEGRYARLFSVSPPTDVLQFSERVVMHKGHLPNPNVAVPVRDAGGNVIVAPYTGRVLRAKPSTASAYCWLVWSLPLTMQTRMNWIGPRRVQLERAGDYPASGLAEINGRVI